MSFKISCPHCQKGLKVTEPAFGKTVPCPGCNQPISIPFPPPGLPDGSSLDEIASGGAPEDQGPAGLSTELPSLTPSMSGQPSPSPTQVPPPGAAPVSPSFSVPPLPGAGVPDGTESLLANYQNQVQPLGGGDMRSRFAAGADGVKKRARAIKLKREVNSLTEAMNSQLESLGTLAMTHKPPTVDMSGEIAELMQVQQQLVQQQGALDSLRMGTGARSVVKQLEGEIAGLRNRQRELVINIGRKVVATRPDMPGTAGVYGALDRIQSSLSVAQTELSTLERQIGPIRMGDLGGGGLISKIACPSGFALALLLFFLPWLTISCQQGGMKIKVMSQSGLQSCYAGMSEMEQPSMGGSTKTENKSDNNSNNLSPAWLIILYVISIVGGLALSVLVILKGPQLQKWVAVCSIVAFCLLTVQMIWGFPVENKIKNLPQELKKQQELEKKRMKERASSRSHGNNYMMGFEDSMGMDNMDMKMMAGAVASKAVVVNYTFSFWLSWLLVLVPGIAIGVEKGLAYSKGNRSP